MSISKRILAGTIWLDDEDMPPESPDPITISDQFLNRWMQGWGGKRFCVHDWQMRKALDVGEMVIVGDGKVTLSNFPAGRFCSKCGKMDFDHSEGATVKWTRKDLPPEP